MKLLFTRKEAALALATSERRLDELIKAGDLAAVQDGPRSVKITATELERYISDLSSHEPRSA